jgi:flagellar hook assembly protein FlgD
LVITLVNDWREASHHQVIWDGRDESGEKVVSGIYFYRLEAGKFKATRKLTIVK